MIYLVPIMPIIHLNGNKPAWFRYTMAGIMLAYSIMMFIAAYNFWKRS